jgi:RND family efflux transporter MFP subunit
VSRAALLGLALVLALAACGDPLQPAQQVQPKGSGSAKPVATDAAIAQSFVGVVTAAESVDIAPRFQGVVATVLVKTGDFVKKDQVVAEMDRKSMQEEVRAAEAAYGAAVAASRQADVDIEDAKRKLALETKMVADGVSPRVNLEEAQLALKRAQASAQKAQSGVGQESSHVQTARDHLADLALRAPSEGTVAMRFKDPGATVPAGAPIVRIVGHGGLHLRFAAPPEQARRFTVGTSVKATVDTVTAPVIATIRQISPALDPSSGMIIVEAELVDEEIGDAKGLRPGLAARVQ